MRIILLYIQLMFYIFSFCAGYSQSNIDLQQQDSLIQIVQSQPSNTAKISSIHQIFKNQIPKSDSLLSALAQQAFRLSSQQSTHGLTMKTHLLYAYSIAKKGSYDAAIAQLKLLEQEAYKHKDTSFWAIAKYDMANYYREQGNYEQALKKLEEAKNGYILTKKSDKLCQIYTTMASIYRVQGLLDSTYKNLQKAANLVTTNQTKAQLNNQYGRYYRAIGQMDSARIAYERNLRIYDLQKEGNELSVTYNNLGNMAHIAGDYKGALNYYVQSKNIKEALGLKRGLAISYHNIGTIRSDLKDFENSKQDFKKSLELSEAIGFKTLIVHNFNRIGALERFDANYKSAIEWHQKALDLATDISFQTEMNQAMLNLGEDYAEQNDIGKALDYFVEGLQISETSADQKRISSFLVAISDLYTRVSKENSTASDIQSLSIFQQRNINTASVEQMLNRAMNIANQLHYAEQKLEAFEALHYFYKTTRNYTKDAILLDQFMIYKDSLFNSERANAIAALETKYEASEKEKEILELETNQKIAAQEQKRLTARTRLYLAIAVGLLGFLLIGFYLFYQLRKIKHTLERQNTKLQEVNATKDTFFGIIAHDIRSPIVALDGVGEQMEYYLKKDKPDKLQRLASRVDATAKQLSNLLDNLLNWALLQQNVISYRPQQLKIQSIVDSTFAMFENNALAKNIQLVSDIDSNVEIFADESAIYTILRNLVSNAIKFTPRKGIVSVAAIIKENHVFISIKDTGIGMTQQQVEQLFSLEKKNTLGTAGEKGTGLGLILVKDLVTLNKGVILVDSNKNQGTTFTIQLPHATHY